MRNDSIERAINDTALTITDYILQKIEQIKRQKDLDTKRYINQEIKNQQRDSPFLSTEEQEEVEYDSYYRLIKEYSPELFEITGDLIETFPFDKNQGVFQIFEDKNQFFGVYKQKTKEAHKITPVFSSKKDVLQKTVGTFRFEKFRKYSFFLTEDGKAFSLDENKHLRLNLSKPFKILTTYENIEQARIALVKEELKKNPKLLKESLYRTLEENHIPCDLLGKTVILQNISKDDKGIQLSLEGNQKERIVQLSDIAEKWIEKIRDNPGMNILFDEIIMESRSIAEGFLAFYEQGLNKEMQVQQHNFEVIVTEEGSYIGKLSSNGIVKQISPYFSEKEAHKQLENLAHHIQLEKHKERQVEKEWELSIEDIEFSEKA